MTRLLPLAFCAVAAFAQQAPPFQPTGENLAAIQAKLRDLRSVLAGVKADPALLADVEIYAKAAEWIVRFPEEFYTAAYVTNTFSALDRGLARAAQLKEGKARWPEQKGRLARGYRSRVDGSVQPYGVVVPPEYNGVRPYRLDVVLHGRGSTLNEVSFLEQQDNPKPSAARPRDVLELHVFGRTNNAYRWSGETDVWEALASVRQRYRVDPNSIVLRGFSMGGAGTWHIGLHHPCEWAAIEAGAGFVDTLRHAKLKDLPPWQDAARRIYDAEAYALNVGILPTVGYGGEDDPQLYASTRIRELLTAEGVKFDKDGMNWTANALKAIFLVGPKMGHKWHPDSQKVSDRFLDDAAALGRRDPSNLLFTTYTAKYGRCAWIQLESLEKSYEKAEVNGSREGPALRLATTNVARLRIPEDIAEVEIDGQKMPRAALIEKQRGVWTAFTDGGGPRKRAGLQGPIDDAFSEPFLCVRPSRTSGAEYAVQLLERFQREFAKYLRGDVPVKEDAAVTPADIRDRNLVLFGDPTTNKLIARVIARLPVRWTADRIQVRGQNFPAAGHTLAMIYPNPLNANRYVVLNSGHTFGEKEFKGTNALLFPRLGDWAVIRTSDGSVVAAGLFDDQWR